MIINGVDIKRPERLQAIVTGKRTKTMYYGIKQASDYTRDAEAYMDTLEAELARRTAEDEATRAER